MISYEQTEPLKMIHRSYKMINPDVTRVISSQTSLAAGITSLISATSSSYIAESCSLSLHNRRQSKFIETARCHRTTCNTRESATIIVPKDTDDVTI